MKKIRHVSKKEAKIEFGFMAKSLLLYLILVLFGPYVIRFYLQYQNIKIDEKLFNYSLILFKALISFLAFGIMKLGLRIRLKDILRPNNFTFKDFLINAIFVLSFGTFIIFILEILNPYLDLGFIALYPIGQMPLAFDPKDPIIVINYLLIDPLLCEFCFRGIWLRALGRYGNSFAVLMIALVFGLAHGSISDAIVYFALSYVLSLVVIKYHDVKPAILLHITFNAWVYLLFVALDPSLWIFSLLIATLYTLAIGLLLLHFYPFIRLKWRKSFNHAAALFLSRPSVLLMIIILVVYILII